MNILGLHRYFSSTELAGVAKLGAVAVLGIDFGQSVRRTAGTDPLEGDAIYFATPRGAHMASGRRGWDFKQVSLLCAHGPC